MSNTPRSRAWVEVDLDALRANFQVVRARARPRLGMLPMVKANAYGLGAGRVVRALEPLEPWGYGVATVEEGVELRGHGVQRAVLVVAPLPPGAEQLAVEAGLTPTISDIDGLDRLVRTTASAGRPICFHVEVDTGMGRAGFDCDRAAGDSGWIRSVRARERADLRWEGVFTHFHSADEPGGAAPSAAQWSRFQDAVAAIRASGAQPIVHAANSAAALRWPEYALDLVRPGIFLYGGDVPDAPAAAPVAAVRARLALVRPARAGCTVGYGATWTAEQDGLLATATIGYGDGLPRALGNRGSMLVRGKRVAICGRISMDMTVLEVSDVPDARAGDIATILGEDGGERITLRDVSTAADTIGYEILTRLGRRLPRVSVGAGADMEAEQR